MSRTESPSPGYVDRLGRFRDKVRSTRAGRFGWRISVTVLGVAIIVVGIVLLALPGPGWLIIFAGLGVLATEFEWASRLLRFARGKVQRWTQWVTSQPRPVQGLIGLLGLAFLAGVLYVTYLLYLS